MACRMIRAATLIWNIVWELSLMFLYVSALVLLAFGGLIMLLHSTISLPTTPFEKCQHFYTSPNPCTPDRNIALPADADTSPSPYPSIMKKKTPMAPFDPVESSTLQTPTGPKSKSTKGKSTLSRLLRSRKKQMVIGDDTEESLMPTLVDISPPPPSPKKIISEEIGMSSEAASFNYSDFIRSPFYSCRRSTSSSFLDEMLDDPDAPNLKGISSYSLAKLAAQSSSESF